MTQLRSRRPRRASARIVWLLGLTLLLGSAPVSDVFADGEPTERKASDGFDAFCARWMKKLAAREQANLASAKFRKESGGVVTEYVGYASKPTRCESRVKRPGSPGVGLLTYHEIRYRRRGADRDTARKSDPKIMERTEITEIFRYDGSAWAY